MMKVGIVVPTINLWDKYTKPAVVSVMQAQKEALEHSVESEGLLLDNGSTDGTKAGALQLFDGGETFKYQHNLERWGFQRSVNFGVKHFFDKGFDIVLVCNNDIVLHKDAIWRLVERFNKGGVGMVTCMDVKGDHPSAEALADVSSTSKINVMEAPHPNFSAFALNKDCWDKVGEFDELFHPAYFEDNDYHYRMKLAGIMAVVYPPALFIHWGSRTQVEALGRPLVSTPDFENNRARYTAKWGGAPGGEQFKLPFNKVSSSIKNVKQQAV